MPEGYRVHCRRDRHAVCAVHGLSGPLWWPSLLLRLLWPLEGNVKTSCSWFNEPSSDGYCGVDGRLTVFVVRSRLVGFVLTFAVDLFFILGIECTFCLIDSIHVGCGANDRIIRSYQPRGVEA